MVRIWWRRCLKACRLRRAVSAGDVPLSLRGRTFIKPKRSMLDACVKLNLATFEALLQGKRAVAVDESIVRGTTSKKIATILRAAGASAVHMPVACLPITGSLADEDATYCYACCSGQ